jgi:hypothetical protein
MREALVGLGEGDFVIVEGTLIRIAADEPNYSQKHKKHGMNIQVIARPDGTPLWFSRATPGRTHGIVQACLIRQILVLADRAYGSGRYSSSRPRCVRNAVQVSGEGVGRGRGEGVGVADGGLPPSRRAAAQRTVGVRGPGHRPFRPTRRRRRVAPFTRLVEARHRKRSWWSRQLL